MSTSTTTVEQLEETGQAAESIVMSVHAMMKQANWGTRCTPTPLLTSEQRKTIDRMTGIVKTAAEILFEAAMKNA